MKRFKNFAFLLVGFLAFALATPKAFAFSISTLSDYNLNNQDDGIATSPQLQYKWTNTSDLNTLYCWSVSPFASYSSWSSMGCWAPKVSLGYYSYLKGQVQRWNSGNHDNAGHLFSFSQVKIERNTDNFNIRLYNNLTHSWDSLYTNGKTSYIFSGVSYDKVVFRDDTAIFYNSETLESLQEKAGVRYHNGILLSNPYDDDGVDNLWLIKLQMGKAWSTTVPVATAGDLMISNIILSPEEIYELFGDSETVKTYDISRGGVNPFPFQVKNQYDQTDQHIKNTYPEEQMFLYSYTSEYVSPDESQNLPNDNNNSINGISNYNISLVNNYNDCVNKGENLRKALQLSAMCKLQGNDSWENIIINTGLNYTGDLSYCIDLDTFISSVYFVYSGNWSSGLINTDINLQDNTAPFNDLIYSWYYNSVVVDSNHNITGLPNGNSWCSAYTVSNFYNNEKSTIEKISDSLTDFFGSGVAGIYNETVGTHSTFSGLISSISSGTEGFFEDNLFNPYIEQFNSGYNKFYSAVSLDSCSVIKQTFPDTIYGTIVFYVAVIGLILFVIRLL